MISAILHVFALVLIQLPQYVFSAAHTIKLTIPFTTLVFVSLGIAYITYCVVKIRVLSQYKKFAATDLPSSKPVKSVDGEQEKKRKMTIPLNDNENPFSSYLEQFLSAIKIFGYLEKPVFLDLTKNMKTQKLNEGEILLLDDSIGLAIVVEGTLQIYHNIDNDDRRTLSTGTKRFDTLHKKSVSPDFVSDENSFVMNDMTEDNSNAELEYSDDEDGETHSQDSSTYLKLKNGMGKFQLLNTVKPGNPVSSLVNILNLFTSTKKAFTESQTPDQKPQFDILQKGDPLIPFSSNDDDEKIPLMENDFLYPVPKIIARAATNCTIAIIPPQSFVKLMAKYPRSASHIIQMVLTRLHRVTFQIAHKYLGLTSEIMEIEQLLNKNVKYELPYYLKEAVINSFDKKSSDGKNYGVLSELVKRPSMPTVNLSNVSISNERSSTLQNGSSPSITKYPLNSAGSRHVVLASRDKYNPGDLLSNVPLSRRDLASAGNQQMKSFSVGSPIGPSPFDLSTNGSSIRAMMNKVSDEDDVKIRSFSSARDETEESAVRMALVEAIFNVLGINRDILSVRNRTKSVISKADLSGTNLKNLNEFLDASVLSVSSLSTSLEATANLRILPSDFAISNRKHKPKKKSSYEEELPKSFDFNTVKNEFAQGIEINHYEAGSLIVEQDSDGKGLFYVISGSIDVTCKSNPDLEVLSFESNFPRKHDKNWKHPDKHLFSIQTGGVAGYLSSLVGFKSFVNLKAKTDTYVGFLSNELLERLSDKYSMINLRMAEILTTLISPNMLKLDHALEWIHLSASEKLFNQGDPANGIYVILNGRVRQLRKNEDTIITVKDKDEGSDKDFVPIAELAQGESFGEVEVLTTMNRMASVVAVRDSELARIPKSLFGVLALQQPSIMFRISRMVAKKILNTTTASETSTRVTGDNGYKYDFNLLIPSNAPSNGSLDQNSSSKLKNFRTITILPVANGLPVEGFASKLVQAFKQVGCNTIGLNQRAALTHLGRHAFDRLSKLKQSGYFAELEEMYQIVVYIADSPVNSSWTSTCIAQGDCILLLADAADDPSVGDFEQLLNKSKTTARTELILLHPERYVEPGSTFKWLKERSWVHAHHHVQFLSNVIDETGSSKPRSMNSGALGLVDKLIQTEFSRKTQQNISKYVPDSIKTKVENFSQIIRKQKRHYYSSVHPHKNDFMRLARILSGQAIGVVLGGGGARGLSHIGVLQAIDEQGIPIDLIGGTSIGAFVGGLYAKDYDIVPIYGRLKKFAGRMSSIWRMLSDLTWPVTSYTTGHEFNRGIWKTFGDTRIEDFWIQYYCNSTNITESIQEIHSFGYAWRYIRASMSLAGLLPPLEENGSMLLDGGYVDNLPVNEMKKRGCNTVFAVDVGSVDDRTPLQYGDSLNGFWILLNRWNPLSSQPNIPTMAEIQMRLGYVSSVNALEKSKRMPGVVYTRPPIENFATLDFAKFEEIYTVGITYGREFLSKLVEQNKMPFIAGSKATLTDSKMTGLLSRRRNSI